MADIDVYLTQKMTGRLTKLAERHVFTYGLDVSEAMSLTMPIRTESYAYHGLHPVFQMNLPEGHLREAIERATAKQYGSDDLTMLAIVGSSQIGRLGYALAGQAFVPSDDQLPDLNSILSSTDVGLFNQLLQRFATCSGVAGVQPKVLMDIKDPAPVDFQLAVEAKATLPFKSYIVKSWGNEYPHLGCNEFVCLTLAKNAGLTVPEFYLSDNAKLLLIKRFDVDEQNNALGFEDFCVLQAKGTREKYDASLESCANTLRKFVSSEYLQQSLSDFFKLTLINILVKNGDAHLKNCGVIYPSLNQYHLGKPPQVKRQFAPVFDIVSTVPYIANDTMALSLTGSKRWPKWKVLLKFAKQHCGLNESKANAIAEQVKQAAQNTLPTIDTLLRQHDEFKPIAEKITALMCQSGIFEK
ncbi:MAG: type II toxin-antitoxin system HipA family toxin [Psychrosphaera sp.]|nr:type II toxin-antitoxin system HipA family toxin [Psychrosphaera sp.]